MMTVECPRCHADTVPCTGGRLCLKCLLFLPTKGNELRPSYREPGKGPQSEEPRW